MGLSASQGRLLLLTARKSDLEYRAQQISQQRLILAQSLNAISREYEEATSNKQMKIGLWQDGARGDGKTQSSMNLTYATLMSGTWSRANVGNSDVYGVLPSTDYNNTEGYATIGSYRLRAADGSIVVSSFTEIPTGCVKQSSYEENAPSDAISLTSFGVSTPVNVSVVQNVIERNGERTIADSENYLKIDENSALADFLKLHPDAETFLTGYTPKDGTANCAGIRVQYKENGQEKNEYFDLKSGEKAEWKSTDLSSAYQVTCTTGEIPKSKVNSTIDNSATPQNLGNNRYQAYDGKIYVVDEALAKGNTADPNYIQDCIREGKYLIQSLDTENNNTWVDTSWDGLSCIEDSYFEGDDAAAKAKYDRLQAEVQSKDKQLELELDQIETQHNAVKTEIESVEQVIKDNIENSFNAFS